ncbi:cytochrome P450 [Aspergillus karnatakaensis]|uniref:cytochrome P450 monooxygenase fmaG n=1 Tax=Aspergillus karnatakaensis TaxID=1810916 RepID=UPI003CCE1A46
MDLGNNGWIVWVLPIVIIYLIYREFRPKTHRLPLPPGPDPIPLLGNLGDFAPDGTPEHLHWLNHKTLYGGISSVTVMGMTLVIIHDKEIANDLLTKMSSKTSGRPSMIMANKLCGYENIILCQSYNPTFVRARKLLHQELGTSASAATFRDAQEVEVNRQLVRSLNEPERWIEHFKTTAAAGVLKMAYDYNIEPHKPDPLVTLTDRMMTEFSLASVPMGWAVDIVPGLQHLPESFPGGGFKKTARKWRKSIEDTAYIPYNFVRRQIAAGKNKPSYVSRLLHEVQAENNGTLPAEDERAIIWTAASLYGAASDTIVITLTTFTLAMLKFPHVQQKAQEEIDRVVGTDRLPNFSDRDNLPYINALIKESLRWWPVAPMGFPHTATEDSEYQGLRIPKGSFLLPAVWWFLHDPEVYADPDSFDPERFLPPRNEPDPSPDAFGYGRRICPGRFFADAGLYLSIVQSLAAFDISKKTGPDGKEIEVDAKPKPGVLMYPTEFEFKVEPRSEKHVELIRELERKNPREESDAALLEAGEERLS